MGNNRFIWVSASKPKPGKEPEYNKWYDRHVTTFFEFPGLKKVRRNKCINPFKSGDKIPQYLTIYEFETREDLEAFGKSEAAARAQREYDEGYAEIAEGVWTGWWETVKTLER